MNGNEKALINLVDLSINQYTNVNINYSTIDWSYIYERSKIHEVHTLIYPLLKKIKIHFCNDELLQKWKSETILAGVSQIQHIKQIKQVLDRFNAENIETVILKGLVLRELYPFPELRTMSDADIFMHKEDVKKARKILFELGYYDDDSNPKHSVFSHKSHMSIEIHLSLINDTYSKNAEYFENNIWNNVVPIYFLDVPVLTLSSEYQLIYLCLHLLDHTLSSGFGLRQLCDVVLLIKSVDNTIDWDEFYNIAKLCHLEKFINIIFSICTDFFHIDIPPVYKPEEIDDMKLSETFMDIIISGSIFGNLGTSDCYSDFILQHSDSRVNAVKRNYLSYYSHILFPPKRNLGERYNYAQKFFFLLPIAWIHRIIYNFIGKQHSLHENTTLFSTKVSDSIRKDQFIDWLK